MSTIRKNLNKLTALPSAARAVLIEVCELVENGGRGQCFAGNRKLGEAACCHPGSVSRHLSVLQKMELLSIVIEGNDNAKRLLIPSPELVHAYQSGDTEGLNTVLRGSSHGVKGGLHTLLKGSSHGVKHTQLLQEDTEQLHGEVATLRAAVSELEGRLAKAAEQYRADQQTIADLKAALSAKSAPKPPKSDNVAAEFPELGFDQFWNTYDKKKGSKSNSRRLWEKLAADTRRQVLNGLAAYKSDIREKQYQPYPETFLNGKEWEAESYGVPAVQAKLVTPTLPETRIGVGGRVASNMTMRSFDELFAPGASTAKEPFAAYGQSTLNVS